MRTFSTRDSFLQENKASVLGRPTGRILSFGKSNAVCKNGTKKSELVKVQQFFMYIKLFQRKNLLFISSPNLCRNVPFPFETLSSKPIFLSGIPCQSSMRTEPFARPRKNSSEEVEKIIPARKESHIA